MKRIAVAIICVLLFIPTFTVNADSGKAEIVMISDTAEIAYSLNCHERLPIASTTKIVTAIVVLENVSDISTVISVPAQACNIEGSSVYLYPGERISIEALLYGLMLNSGNDAATALAITVGGSVENFADMMNEFAASLGLKDTHFVNPHGLENDEHYSSAYDMAMIMRYAIQNDDFVKISSAKSISFRKQNGQTRYFSNHNRLLREYKYAVCGKTGFIQASGRCLVSCAKKDGVTVICVTLSCYGDFERHIALCNEVFSKYRLYDVEEHLEMKFDAVGAQNDIFFASVQESVMLPLRSEEDISSVSVKVLAPHFIYSPVKFGDSVGTAVYYKDGVECARREIVAVNSAPLMQKKSLIQKIIDFFGRLFK